MVKIKHLLKRLGHIVKHSDYIRFATAFVVCTIVFTIVLTGCVSDDNINELTGCTVKVKTEGGMVLENIGVYIYIDSTREELVYYARTNEEGIASITEAVPVGSVAVLEGVPTGYSVEENYSIVETVTDIVLSSSLMGEITDISAGSVMFDFEVKAYDGNVYKLSELLEEKKAVVLNFWYLRCDPCKLEFPYLQQAYEEYAADIEVVALDPVDGSDEKIANFAEEYGLTFPMAVGDENWAQIMKLSAYPTTVVIDRYGTVAFIHKGMVTDAETFKNIFQYFTSDDYQQTIIKSISEIE